MVGNRTTNIGVDKTTNIGGDIPPQEDMKSSTNTLEDESIIMRVHPPDIDDDIIRRQIKINTEIQEELRALRTMINRMDSRIAKNTFDLVKHRLGESKA